MGAGKFVDAVKLSFQIVADPKHHFQELEKKTFEKAVGYYVRLLISVGIIAALINLVFWMGRSAYYDVFFTVQIDYLRMLNYTLATSSAVLFFYLYAGTFLLFILSIIINLFVRSHKYAEVLKILFYATTPLILFGWVPPTPIPFVVWSIFLFVVGVKSYKSSNVKKESIQNRD